MSELEIGNKIRDIKGKIARIRSSPDMDEFRRIKDRQSEIFFTSPTRTRTRTSKKEGLSELEKMRAEFDREDLERKRKEGIERIKRDRLAKKDRPKARETEIPKPKTPKRIDPNKVSDNIISRYGLDSRVNDLSFKRPNSRTTQSRLLSDIRKNRVLDEKSRKLNTTKKDIENPINTILSIYHNKLIVGFIVYITHFLLKGRETEIKLIATGKPTDALDFVPLGRILLDTVVEQENTNNLLVKSVLSTATKKFWVSYGMTRDGTEDNLAVYRKKIRR